MKLIELVSKCLSCQLFKIMNGGSGVTIYKGRLEIDDFICQYNVRAIKIQDDYMAVYVDVE